MTELIKIFRERKKIIFVLPGILFLFIFSFYFSLAAKISRKAKELDGLKIQLKSVNENLRIIKELKVNKRLIKEEDASLVVDTITKQCQSHSLELKSITRKEKNIKDGYSLLPVYLEVEGEFKQIGLFLSFLREFEGALITVDNFQIRSTDMPLPKIAGLVTLTIYLSNE
ncbi:MAG: type 4a pilus biogenesis protein PilO [Candidatus Omnitrophota bacterium]|nr:type 4a pilus biogenesis protein PilO [Candidatus Omnitrophota bacterium]